jgi:hypothetical protein
MSLKSDSLARQSSSKRSDLNREACCANAGAHGSNAALRQPLSKISLSVLTRMLPQRASLVRRRRVAKSVLENKNRPGDAGRLSA